MSPKKQFPEFNYQLLHHVKLVKIFQQYCHLHFAGNISKLGYLDEEMEQVITLFWTGAHLLGYYSSMQMPAHSYININSKLMC